MINYGIVKEQKQHGEIMLPIALYHLIHEKTNQILYCHWHEEIEIILMAAGSASFTIDDETFLLHAGDCLFVNAGQLHTGYARSEYTEYYSIVFSTDLLTNPFDSCRFFFEGITSNTYRILPHFSKEIPLQEKIINELNEVIEALLHKDTAYELAVKSKLFSFFYLLFKEKIYTEGKDKLTNSILSPKHAMLKKILGYIYTNYNSKIKLKDISNSVNLTPQYLCVFFKEMTDLKLFDYINQYRIDSAVNLLKSSDLSITAIALECGFDNPSYFNRVFKRQVGCTPSCYRSTAK